MISNCALRLAILTLGLSSLSACGDHETEANQVPATQVVSGRALTTDDVAVSSTAMVFDLSAAEKMMLSEKALQGDAEASFRLAQFYSLAGGDGDPNVNDESDRREERRWLELAAKQGHPAGEFNLAVELAPEDCQRARSIMTRIRDHSPDSGRRDLAASWLRDRSFDC